ncbi:MAG TPA: hypothetical protein PKC76_00550 [Saprospiraceae bacterium]|nr:hypothetical protein [Saprospiraceae bacterium]HMP22581.1 hypothetical protein [Saprospiraceae bacterium]
MRASVSEIKTAHTSLPWSLRLVARLVSALFNPLLMPTYLLALLIIVNPYIFGVNGLGDSLSKLLMLRVFLSTFFIPLVAIVMLRATGLLQSFELRDSQERIAPYIITGVFYLWMFRNFYSNSQIPTAYTTFMLGITIALFMTFFINIFSRISAHTVGMGALVGMVLITMLLFSYDTFIFGNRYLTMSTLLIAVLLLAGLVGTARQILYPYTPMDLYGGYFVGFLAQFIALRFIF